MSTSKNKPIRHTDEVKQKAVKLDDAGKSAREIAKELGVQNYKTVKNWIEQNKNGELGKKKGKGKSGDRLARQECLLTILSFSSKEGVKNEVILKSLKKEGYVICTETLNRDLIAMIQRGWLMPGDPEDIVDNEEEDKKEDAAQKTKVDLKKGWYKNKESALRLSQLSITDALSLNLLEQFLKPILPETFTKQLKPVFEQAKKKLEEEAKVNKLAEWSEQVAVVESGLCTLPPESDFLSKLEPNTRKKAKIKSEAAQETIRRALMAKKTVEVTYVKAGGNPKTHLLHPLGLIQRGMVTYLIAICPHKDKPDAPIPYAMHRVMDASIGLAPVRVPEDFALKSYIEKGQFNFGAKGLISLKAWVSNILGPKLKESKLAKDQKLEPKGDGFELTATIMDSWLLDWWILSKTGDIVVREPSALREKIALNLREGAARYD